MKNSKLTERSVMLVTAVLCILAAASMLLLEESSLVVDLVYAGF
jgi:hypothetical protein